MAVTVSSSRAAKTTKAPLSVDSTPSLAKLHQDLNLGDKPEVALQQIADYLKAQTQVAGLNRAVERLSFSPLFEGEYSRVSIRETLVGSEVRIEVLRNGEWGDLLREIDDACQEQFETRALRSQRDMDGVELLFEEFGLDLDLAIKAGETSTFFPLLADTESRDFTQSSSKVSALSLLRENGYEPVQTAPLLAALAAYRYAHAESEEWDLLEGFSTRSSDSIIRNTQPGISVSQTEFPYEKSAKLFASGMCHPLATEVRSLLAHIYSDESKLSNEDRSAIVARVQALARLS